MNAVRVILITGEGRSGSTMLSSHLGRQPGWFGAGEIAHLWDAVDDAHILCSCGSEVQNCEIWGPVARGVPALRAKDQRGFHAYRRSLRWRHLPLLLLRPRNETRYSRAVQDVLASCAQVYRAIQRVTGASIIVDTSKNPMQALAFANVGLPGVDVTVLHLIRDPRAVAHSWQRRRPERGGRARRTELPRYGAIRSACRWVLRNALASTARRRSQSQLLLRYEDFVQSPHVQTRRILEEIGHPLGFADEMTAEANCETNPQSIHVIAGNPSRFDAVTARLRLDDAWRREAPRWRSGLVSLLTSPWLISYGYTPSLRGLHEG